MTAVGQTTDWWIGCINSTGTLHLICHPLVKQKSILQYFYLMFQFFPIYSQQKNNERGKNLRSTVMVISPLLLKVVWSAESYLFSSSWISLKIRGCKCISFLNREDFQSMKLILPFGFWWDLSSGRHTWIYL